MTAPTQRPASTSDARKRLAENTPAERCSKCGGTLPPLPVACSRTGYCSASPEPDADERLRERAEAFLVQCGPCDAGLPMGCACPDADPRPVIAELLAALASRTPDAHLAAAKAEGAAEALEEAAAMVLDKAVPRRVSNTSDQRLVGNVRRDIASDLRARAARLREQGGE